VKTGLTAYLGLHRRGFEPSSYTPHQHVVTYSPHHLIVRVSLAKRPRHKLQDALQFFCPTLFLPLICISSTKKGAATSENKTNLPPWPSCPPPPRSPDCPPHKVTYAEVNIAQAAPPSLMRTNEAPVANLFGVSQGVTQNKRSSIPREKTGHTPARKKQRDATLRASSVRVRVTIQEALSAEMSTLTYEVGTIVPYRGS